MLPGMELMSCPDLAVPRDVMHHVVRVESSYNPYAIGVVGGRLMRQPRSLAEAVSTARMLEQRGYNFSLGLAQVNRYNLAKYGLKSYEQAFQPCENLVAGSRILRECYSRSGGDWGKSFSCYYSGDFRTGFRHGYVQKVYASMRRGQAVAVPDVAPLQVISRAGRRVDPGSRRNANQSMAITVDSSANLALRRGASLATSTRVPATDTGAFNVGAPVTSDVAESALGASGGVALPTAAVRQPVRATASIPTISSSAQVPVVASADAAFVF